MGCCHYYAPSAGGDDAFSIDISAITFGLGVLSELGDHARARGIERIALMTDKVLGGLEHVAIARKSLADAGIDAVPAPQACAGRRAGAAKLWPQK